MAIFGQYGGGDAFNVAGNMDAVLKQQQATNQSMLDAVAKFNSARDEMDTLRKTTGAILSQYGVDDKGKPADSAPKYVHDLYNSINKEGGLANISRSQMVAGIQAYQTGVGIEQQQLQLESARNANRHNAIATDMAQMQLDAAKRQLEEQARIRQAKTATQADIEKLSKTKTQKTTESVFNLAEDKSVNVPTEELKPWIAQLNKEDATNEEKMQAKREVEKLIHKYDPDNAPVAGGDTSEGDPNPQFTANKNFKPLVSAYAGKPKQLKAGEKYEPTYDVSTIEGFISRESRKFKESSSNPENTQWDARAKQEEAARAIGYTADIYGATLNDKQSEELITTLQSKQSQLKQAETDYKNGTVFVPPSGGNGMPMIRPMTAQEKQTLRIDIANKRSEIKRIDAQLSAKQESLLGTLKEATKKVTPYTAGEIKLKASGANEYGYVEEKTTVEKQIQKDLYEQTDDEYAILSNWMKANGGIPETFTKEAYYASKGISKPIVMDIGGGQMYANIGGKAAFLENKSVSQSALSISDQKALYQAKELATARDLSGFQTNGFRFSGQIRVGDIDQANKVKLELGTTTRALANVDRLIRIAEDASLYDKLMPNEISGIAQALTNAAQSANRTEIGGSGAWSNQDQAYMDKIIRDPSSGFNALFTSQTIASLKEYRSRLAAGLQDKGAVYGFRYEQSGSQGVDKGMQQLRVAYAQLMASGNYTPQEAIQIAKQHLEANYE